MNNEAKKCESCGITDDDQKLLECAGCLSAYFCSTSCQQQSWRLHKKICRQRKKSVIKIQSNWRGYESRQQLMHINDGRPRCEVCGITNSKTKQLHICNGCKVSLFCSKKCQDYAWKKRGHREFCLERQRAAVTVQRMWRERVRRREERKRRREEMKRRIMGITRAVVNMMHMVVLGIIWTVETMKDMIMSVKNAMVNVMSSIILGLIQAAGAMKGIMLTPARVLALLGIFYFIHEICFCLRIYYGVSGKWEAQQGESTRLFISNEQIMNKIRRKWEMQLKESKGVLYRHHAKEGYFYCYVDEFGHLPCDLYDAFNWKDLYGEFSTHKWEVDWDANLEEYEVMYVRSNREKIIESSLYPSTGLQGYTLLKSPYDEDLMENYKRVLLVDIYKYLSLKKVLAALDLDNVYTIEDHASYLYVVNEFRKLLTNAATPFCDVILTSKNLISITKLLSFDDYKSGLPSEAAVLMNQIIDYTEKLKLTTYKRDKDKTKRILDEFVFDEGAGVTLHLVHVLLRCLSSDNVLVNEASTRLLGLISMTSPKFSDAMLSDGAIRLVLNNILKPRRESHFVDSLETFFWLCSGEVPPIEEVKVISPILSKVITKYDPVLTKVITKYDNVNAKYIALLTLQRILSGGHDYAMALIDAGVVTNLLEFIKGKRFINFDRDSLLPTDLQPLALDIVESIVRLPSLALDIVESITAEL